MFKQTKDFIQSSLTQDQNPEGLQNLQKIKLQQWKHFEGSQFNQLQILDRGPSHYVG